MSDRYRLTDLLVGEELGAYDTEEEAVSAQSECEQPTTVTLDMHLGFILSHGKVA